MDTELLKYLGLGIVIFITTGIDDLCVVYLLFKDRSKRQKTQIFFGTLLGVCLMLLLSITLSKSLTVALTDVGPSGLLRLLGIIPIAFGIIYLSKLSEIDSQSEKIQDPAGNGFKYFILAFSIYMGNSADDFSVNISTLANIKNSWEIIFLALGNIFGALVMMFVALLIRRLDEFLQNFKVEKFFQCLASVALISIGLLILNGTLN